MFRYMHEEVNDIRPARNYNDPSPNPGAVAYTPALNALLRWTYDITPSIINTAGLAYTYQKVSCFPPETTSFPQGSSIRHSTTATFVFPESPSATSGLGSVSERSPTSPKLATASSPMTLHGFTAGTLVQVGGLYMWNILRVNASAFSQGNFAFGSAPTPAYAGDFLLGSLTTYSQSNVQRAGAFHQHWFELYGQDDYKVLPRLTLSLGLRYSFYSPSTMEGNEISNFNAGTFHPAGARRYPRWRASSSTVLTSRSPQPALLLTTLPTGLSLPARTAPHAALPPRRRISLLRASDSPTGSTTRHDVAAWGLWHRLHAGWHVPDLGSHQQLALCLHAFYPNTQFSNPAGGPPALPVCSRSPALIVPTVRRCSELVADIGE